MKAISILPMLLCLFATAASLAGETPDNDSLIAFAQQRTNAVRVTDRPMMMSAPSAVSCYISPVQLRVYNKQQTDPKFPKDPHVAKYVHVFVSPQGAPAMQTESAVFPVGTIILKEKFSDSEGKNTELFTGMLKHEPGDNPACGDWEFFALSANAKQVTARGKLESCMTCHREFPESDFVTKTYISYHPATHP
jgi:hypothetical protein